VTVKTKATPEQCHNLSHRLCSSLLPESDTPSKPFPDLPDLKTGGVIVSSFMGTISFSTTPPSEFTNEDKIILHPNDRLLFFSGQLDCDIKQCCVRTLGPVDVNVNRKIEGGIVVKRKNREVVDEELEEGGEKKERMKKKPRAKASKKEPVFTVKDVEKLVNLEADNDSDDLYYDILPDDPDFELIDDAPPPFSSIQLEEDIIDVAELLVQVVVSGLDPFPKQEGTKPIKLTFDC
jgi:hypothetical protein